MRRNCSLEEISDGKLYTSEDLVEASCNGCKGAASCCHGMGNTIILDPFDIYRMTTKLDLTIEELLKDRIELNLVDSIILPNLKLSGADESCSFLNEEGRCGIHSLRPGICRIFPLGRYYENHGFKYILQTGECRNTSTTKVRISKWIDIPDLKEYERYLIDWHYFLKDAEVVIKGTQDEALIKNLNMCILNGFFVRRYAGNIDFYTQFYERLNKIINIIKA